MLAVVIGLLDYSILSCLAIWTIMTEILMLLKYVGWFIWIKWLTYKNSRGDPWVFILLLQSMFTMIAMTMNWIGYSCIDDINLPEKLVVNTRDAILSYLLSFFTVLLVFFVLYFQNGLRQKTTFLQDKIVQLQEKRSDFMAVYLLYLAATWRPQHSSNSEDSVQEPVQRRRRQNSTV